MLEGAAYTSNQQAVFSQLQTIDQLTPEESTLINTIVLLPLPQAQFVLDQMSGEPYTHAVFAAESANQQFIKRLYTPLRDIITADPEMVDENYDACNDYLHDFWIDAGWDRCFVDGSKNAKGYKASGYDITLGAQLTFNRNWTAGAALSYQNQPVTYNIDGISRNCYGFGGLYAVYRPSDYYILGDLVFSFGRQKFKRRVDAGTLSYEPHGKPEIYQGNVYLEAGKDYECWIMLAQPFISVEAGYLRRSSIKEHSRASDLVNLSIDETSFATAHGSLGVHLSTQRFSRLAVAIDLAWRYRFTPLVNDIRGQFQNFGSEFHVEGVNISRNSLNGAISLSANVVDDLEIFVEATGQWWPRATAYNLFGGIMFSW